MSRTNSPGAGFGHRLNKKKIHLSVSAPGRAPGDATSGMRLAHHPIRPFEPRLAQRPLPSMPTPPFVAILSRVHCPNLRNIEPDACVSNGARLAHCLTRYSNSELPYHSPPSPSLPQVAFRALPYSSRRSWWCRAASAKGLFTTLMAELLVVGFDLSAPQKVRFICK